jgi:hypothetical protein
MKEILIGLKNFGEIDLGSGEMFLVNIILAFVMFGVALGIKVEMFKDVFKNPKNVGEIEQNNVGAVITVKFYRFFEKLGKITASRGFSKRNFKRKYRQNSEAGKFAYLR